MTAFLCSDARGFITYNGVGQDRSGRSPSDWIAELPSVTEQPLDAMLSLIESDSNRRLNQMAKQPGRLRHSFVISGFRKGIPFQYLLSNYEALDSNFKDRGDLDLSRHGGHFRPNFTGIPFSLICTGDGEIKTARLRRLIGNPIREGADRKVVLKSMIKIVRDVAHSQGRRGSVGPSVMFGIVGLNSEFTGGVKTPGGALLQEMPNFLAPQARFTNIWMSRGESFARYDPIRKKGVIPEPPCGHCGSPVPAGNIRCCVCLERTKRAA